MGMFVRENQLVYFLGRISPLPFTDEFPYPLLFAFLWALAPWRDAKIPLLPVKTAFRHSKTDSTRGPTVAPGWLSMRSLGNGCFIGRLNYILLYFDACRNDLLSEWMGTIKIRRPENMGLYPGVIFSADLHQLHL
jgi:hypothetical protein